MSKKKTIKLSENKNTDTKQGDRILEEQTDHFHQRIVTISCITGVICALLLLVFFFSSDISGKIIATKTAPVYAVQSTTVEDTEVSDQTESASDLVSDLHNADVNREDVMDRLRHMNDEEFQTFASTIVKKAEKRDTDTSEIIDQLLQNAHNKAEVIAYLQEMNDSEFEVFITDIRGPDHSDEKQQVFFVSDGKAISESSGETGTSDETTIEDAYAEAEQLYPGQIDGSKRLKRIEDLNATDYMYYVAEEGDTLIDLSRAFDVPLGQLVELNGIQDADVIPAGMVVLFPSETEQPDLSSVDQ